MISAGREEDNGARSALGPTLREGSEGKGGPASRTELLHVLGVSPIVTSQKASCQWADVEDEHALRRR